MNKVPKAEDFFKEKSKELKSDPNDMPAWMIDHAAELAKLHVKAAVRKQIELEYDRVTDEKTLDTLTEKALKHTYPLNNII